MSDHSARAQALDPQHSFIVKAPAGSGKTELLTQRFLKLLCCVQTPEEILAVTFTRKAAAQMRQRILLALSIAKNQPQPQKAHERTTWELARQVLNKDEANSWHLQQNPNRLRIMTIDALCAQIVCRMPILSHFGTMPQICDYPQRYYEQAVSMMFKETTFEEQWASSLQKLLLHLDNKIETIFDLLVMMLAKRDQWLPHLGLLLNNVTGLEAYLNNCFKEIIESHLAQVRASFSIPQQSQLLAALRYANSELEKVSENHLLGVIENFETLPDASSSSKVLWEAIAEFLTTKQNTWRKAYNQSNGFPSPSESKNKEEKAQRKEQKECIISLTNELSEHESLLELLNEIKILPPTQLSESQHNILAALSELLPVLVAFLQVVFRQVSQVDFIEVTLRALDALGDELAPSDIALSLDYQLRHLLIDEYQDTSVTQFRLFEKLVMGWQPGDGRTLFLVGDPMQSIYRFRGAEVSLFMHTQAHGLSNMKFIPLSLTVNFRSADSLIDWINSSFLTIFPQKEEKTFGAVAYSTAQAFQSSTREKVIAFHPVTQENGAHAQTIINIILETLALYPNDNVAILVRKKKDLTEIIHQLKQTRIPFVAHEVEHLANRPHITDLVSLLKATTDWTDKVSWYAILRAPWLGLSLADLLVLSRKSNTGILWEVLQDENNLQEISGESKIRLAKFIPYMRYFLDNRQRKPLSMWLKGLWIALGGPACYVQTDFLNDIEKILQLIDDYANAGKIEALAVFESKLSEIYGDISPVMSENQDNHSQGMVELMTIHKAKGLEFDTVILPHLEGKNLNQDHGLLLWLERSTNVGVSLILAPKRSQQQESDSLYRYVLKQIQKKANYEAARLLYVAATRAKKTLHLLAQCKIEGDKQFKPHASSFLEMLWPAFERTLLTTSPSLEVQPDASKEFDEHKNTLQRLPLDWKLPQEIEAKLNENMSCKEQDSLNVPENHDFVARAAGKVFHRILQDFANYLSQIIVVPEHVVKSCELALKRYGLTSVPLKKAQTLILKALHNMFLDEKGQWILNSQHVHRHAEWRLSVKSGKNIENNVIDFSFVDASNTRWIVDYKLTHLENMSEEVLQEEIERYRPQLLKYQKMLAKKEKRTIRCGLYFPLAKVWWEYV